MIQNIQKAFVMLSGHSTSSSFFPPSPSTSMLHGSHWNLYVSEAMIFQRFWGVEFGGFLL